MTGTINVSMKTKLLVLGIFIIFFIAIASLIGTIFTVSSINKTNIDNYKNDIYLKTQTELRNYIQVTIQTIDSFYQRTSKEKIALEVKEHLNEQMGLLFSILSKQYELKKDLLNKEELKKELVQIIKSTRYGKHGYFWVNDFEAKMIMHPILPNLNNKNLINLKDENGKELFKAFINIAQNQNEGFVNYVWPKPKFEKAQEKISLVRVFEPFNWIIGTGSYVEDITKNLQKEALKTISQIRYGENGYFWINNSDSKMIMHPILPDLNGKDLTNMQDKSGQFPFREFSTLANKKKEGGIVLYMWPKPNEKEAKPKFSYVQKFEPWDWIIGTGAYIDDVEAKVKKMQEESKQSLQIVVVISAVIFILILIILSLITLALSTKRDGKNFVDEY